MKVNERVGRLRKLTSVIGVGLVAAAVLQELRKPAVERKWHGQLWGRVPYEFRVPTLERLHQAYWKPDEPRVFTDTAFGVGWAINVGRLLRLCTGSCLHRTPTAAG